MNLGYIGSYNSLENIDLIHTRGEVCIFGRSNVGKSSLINSICGQKIAFTSKKPGKTVSLNFFRYNVKYTLVDTPGYGFANQSRNITEDWQDIVYEYLFVREKLKKCYILIDSRRGIMEIDFGILEMLEESGKKYTIIYTKVDEINKEFEETKEKDIEFINQLKLKNVIIPESGFISVSSKKNINIKKLIGEISLTLREQA